MTDVRIQNEGSIFLFHAETEKAEEWIEKEIGGYGTYFAGALVVEHRYARDLAEGMIQDGLTVA